jgi:hypothetical protein
MQAAVTPAHDIAETLAIVFIGVPVLGAIFRSCSASAFLVFADGTGFITVQPVARQPRC